VPRRREGVGGRLIDDQPNERHASRLGIVCSPDLLVDAEGHDLLPPRAGNCDGDLGLLAELRDEPLEQLDDRGGTGAHWFATFRHHTWQSSWSSHVVPQKSSSPVPTIGSRAPGVTERPTMGHLPGHTASVQPQRTRRPEILLMADYGCFTWTSSPELYAFRSSAGLDIASLGVSPDLARRLAAWHEEWEEDSVTWEQRGWRLACELQEELADIDVYVWDVNANQGRPVRDLPRL
jgi:hypothetical protein